MLDLLDFIIQKHVLYYFHVWMDNKIVSIKQHIFNA